ncbi:hypothetical protein V6Z20_03660 [Brucella abortus]
MGNLRNGHIQRSALSDGADGSINQFAPPQGFHPDLGHDVHPVVWLIAGILSLIDWSINKNPPLKTPPLQVGLAICSELRIFRARILHLRQTVPLGVRLK